MFWLRNEKLIFYYALLSKDLNQISNCLPLFIFKDFPIETDTIRMGLSILYFKGSQFRILNIDIDK